MAREFQAAGARVVAADISGAEREAGADLAVQVDVSNAASVEALIAQTVQEFGRIDVMCNNAGIEGDPAPTHKASIEDFDHVLAVDLRGVFLGTRFAAAAMLAGGGGSIINTASVAGILAFPGFTAYCAAKAGVLGITRATAAEYAGQGIRVNAILPGTTRTPRLQALIDAGDPAIAGMTALTPAGRLAEPEEMARVAVFLASDAAAFVTGIAMPVDGGYHVI
jgi:NAD(P)-dependent dehydrogenase (short-subunit alcohol dehydrogenase family)